MTITKLNYEVYALDYLEGTLSKEEQTAMERFLLSHPEIAMELEAMSEMVALAPDPLITFQHKEKLLKKESRTKVIFWWKWQLGAAAAIALLVVFSSLWNQNFSLGNEPVAQVEQDKYEEKVPKTKEVPAILPLPSERIATTNKEVALTNSRTTVSNKEAKKASLANTESRIANTPQKLAINRPVTKVINRQTLSTNYPLEKTSEAITRPIEVAATVKKIKTANRNRTVEVVAALPISDIEAIGGISDFKKIAINTQQILKNNKELLADNTPKKRTLKSMLGKLPGDKIGVSIIPSFFTDKVD